MPTLCALLVIGLAFCTVSQAQYGSLDPSFGSGGVVLTKAVSIRFWM